jgi:hypothetical protein
VLRQIPVLPPLEVLSELTAQVAHTALTDAVHFQSVRQGGFDVPRGQAP